MSFLVLLTLLPLGAFGAQSSTPIVPTIGTTTTAKVTWDTFSDTWVATDGLDRALPTYDTLPSDRKGLRANKTVGMFYYLWENYPGRAIYDNTQILAANPTNPSYGPINAFHWWGQPLFGYYTSADPAVIRKHMQMLSDAGVDVLIFDATNGLTYPDVYVPIFQVLRQMHAQGMRAPQVTFLTGNNTWTKIYDELYSKSLYSELWYRYQGKPLLLAHYDESSSTGLGSNTATLKNFFTVRYSWAWDPGQGHWDWTEYSPQKGGSFDSNGKLEEVSVSAASHPVNSIGRSYQGNTLQGRGNEPSVDQRFLTSTRGQGLYFTQQWNRALDLDPGFILLTNWNEWIAQRFVTTGNQSFAGQTIHAGGTYFVDEFNAEFSRDIEPSTDLLVGDNFYYQLASNIRRYKGARLLPVVSPRPISLTGSFLDWQNVTPEFRDNIGDPVHRDFDGWGKNAKGKNNHYTNTTGRNDLVASKVSYDSTNLYFYVRTREPITAPGANPQSWMMLFLDTDQNHQTGWLGYDYVINRVGVGTGTTTLEKNVGGVYQWDSGVSVSYRRRGRELEIAIPRSALGLTGLPKYIDFKWADGIMQTGDWTDFTLNGDVAPNDRFNYRAKFTAQ